MLIDAVIAVSLTTFMYTLICLRSVSFCIVSSSSSHKCAKSLVSSSLERSMTSSPTGASLASLGSSGFSSAASSSPLPPALSAVSSAGLALSPLSSSASSSAVEGSLIPLSACSKKTTNSASSTTPSLFVSKRSNTSSFDNFLHIWLYLTTFSALTRKFSSSAATFFVAWSRKRTDKFVARLNLESILPIRISSCLASVVRKDWRSSRKRSSMSALRLSICFLAAATFCFAPAIISSVSSESFVISGAGMVLAFTVSGCTCFSTWDTS
mmetsp:Transcript_29422/g.77781  ORF Transcript_29422/g.77781 Transcript_29422/m.77781 type:complete len:268 (-) Transcript_29422:328-1131(-)